MSDELNKMIVIRVYGWREYIGPTGVKCIGHPTEGGHRDIPDFANDIAKAWELRAHMVKRGFNCIVAEMHRSLSGALGVMTDKGCHFTPSGQDTPRLHIAETTELAICIAALRAVGVSDKEIQEVLS